jgi:hypothetical protein
MRPFEIFKPGTHTSASGQTLDFGDDIVARSMRVYDPKVHEAPIVVGHPKDNGPAFGWVEKLDYADGVMVAHPKDVDPDFAEMVAAKRFKKRSASFYAPGSANHPLKGTADHDTYYLRHVGFLGAAAPAVKGLKDVEFSDDDEGIVEFEESARWAWNSMASLFRSFREWLISDKDLETADRIAPSYLIADIEAAAREAAAKNSPLSYEEPDMTLTAAQITELQNKAARADALETENASLKTAHDKAVADFNEATGKLTEAERKLSISGIKEQLQTHVKAGRLLPAHVDAEADFIASLDDSAQTFDFSEGEGDAKKTGKESARARYLRQIAARPVAVDFGERAPADRKGEPEDIRAVQQKITDQVMGRDVKK